ncbi:MAG: hypothetical protein M1816_005331, partial [Peltula sp. TS41687]
MCDQQKSDWAAGDLGKPLLKPQAFSSVETLLANRTYSNRLKQTIFYRSSTGLPIIRRAGRAESSSPSVPYFIKATPTHRILKPAFTTVATALQFQADSGNKRTVAELALVEEQLKLIQELSMEQATALTSLESATGGVIPEKVIFWAQPKNCFITWLRHLETSSTRPYGKTP